MRGIVKASRRPRRFAQATGTAASPMLPDGGFRTALPAACDASHRRATRSLPKALGSRLYESIIRTFGISHWIYGLLLRNSLSNGTGKISPEQGMK